MNHHRTLLTLLAACLAALLSACASTAPKASGPASGSYAFWPTFPDDPHIQFVRSISTSNDVAPKKASALEKVVFGKELDKAATINKPYGIAMKHGCIYVADIRNNCVVVLDLRQKQTRLVGLSGINQLKKPVAVAVGDDSTLYVADLGRGCIMVYDSSERYSRAYGHPDFKPSSLAIHGDFLYATDMTSQRVEAFDRNNGKSLGLIGSIGDEDGQFRLPIGVATDKIGNVYVVDMLRCRLQKFMPDGRFVGAVGAMGKVAGTFARPKHLAVDDDGIVYVVDAAFQNVQMFDPKFELLMHFGAAGDYPGAMNLPAGICISDDPQDLELLAGGVHPGFKPKRVVAVSNQFGDDRVSLYVMGDLREGYTAQDLAKAAIAVTPGTGKATPEEVKFSMPGSEEPPPPGAQPPAPQPPSKP
jgi:DNA-binding beta-propeller fold protein YncE